MFGFIKDTVKSVGKGALKLGKKVSDGVASVGKSVGNAAQDLGGKVKGGLDRVKSGVKKAGNAALKIGSKVSEGVGKAGRWLGDAAEMPINAIGAGINAGVDGIKWVGDKAEQAYDWATKDRTPDDIDITPSATAPGTGEFQEGEVRQENIGRKRRSNRNKLRIDLNSNGGGSDLKKGSGLNVAVG